MQLKFLSNIRHTVHNATAMSALAFYLFAAVLLPVVHVHSIQASYQEKHSCCGHSGTIPVPQNDNQPCRDCSVCDVINSAVPLFQFAEPLFLSAEVYFNVLRLSFSLPSAETFVLPPCRAPPLI